MAGNNLGLSAVVYFDDGAGGGPNVTQQLDGFVADGQWHRAHGFVDVPEGTWVGAYITLFGESPDDFTMDLDCVFIRRGPFD